MSLPFKSPADCYTLSNGVKIPCLGLGTWQTRDGDEAISSVLAAIEVGYRHIDTARAYENEAGIGAAVKQSGIGRDNLFITSKLWNTEHGYEKTMAAFEATMSDLALDYLDMYLIHWPNPAAFRNTWQETNAGTWKAFEELYKAGRIRAIGVSNFRQHHLEELLKTAEIAPQVNQMRLCPGATQDETVEYSRSKDMLLEAYSPSGTGAALDVPELKEIAVKYGKSVPQICIRWSLQRGYLPLPKSVTPSRIKENAQVFDFELDPAEVSLIAGLNGCVGYADDPDVTPF
jgi:diketogulonate reductase-like aldo/keto reductase